MVEIDPVVAGPLPRSGADRLRPCARVSLIAGRHVAVLVIPQGVSGQRGAQPTINGAVATTRIGQVTDELQ